MCKTYGIKYNWCGHSNTPIVTKRCSVPDCKQTEWLPLDRAVFGGPAGVLPGKAGFCDKCLLDPELSTMARRVDGETTLGYSCDQAECRWATTMWGIIEPNCPSPGGEPAEFFKASGRRTMLSVYTRLSKHFFWSLQNPDQPRPTMFQRHFLMFMRSALDSFSIMDLQFVSTKPGLFQQVKIESLKDQPKACGMCKKSYGHIHDFPYRISCGHVFGGTCIRNWANKHHGCPVCNAAIEPTDRLPSDDEPRGWLDTLMDSLDGLGRHSR